MAQTKTEAAPAAKTLYAVRDFRDAGSERQFTKGKLPDDVSAGEVENYRAAGLVSDERPSSDA